MQVLHLLGDATNLCGVDALELGLRICLLSLLLLLGRCAANQHHRLGLVAAQAERLQLRIARV